MALGNHGKNFELTKSTQLNKTQQIIPLNKTQQIAHPLNKTQHIQQLSNSQQSLTASTDSFVSVSNSTYDLDLMVDYGMFELGWVSCVVVCSYLFQAT